MQPFITEPDLVPIMNPFNTTMMPLAFRCILILIIFVNTVSVLYFEYFVVNKALGKELKDLPTGSHEEIQRKKPNSKKILELLEKTDRSDGSPFVNMALL